MLRALDTLNLHYGQPNGRIDHTLLVTLVNRY